MSHFGYERDGVSVTIGRRGKRMMIGAIVHVLLEVRPREIVLGPCDLTAGFRQLVDSHVLFVR